MGRPVAFGVEDVQPLEEQMDTRNESAAVRATEAEPAQPKRKKRTPMSCDRCKSRKTKCIGPVPGPCQYCASIGVRCEIDMRARKKRPFYHVTEEEYRYMVQILKHQYPGRELNLHTLRELARELDISAADTGESNPSNPNDGSSTNDDLQGSPADDVANDEIRGLYDGLGSMIVDSRGKYRHIGADSGISFNGAVRALTEGPQPTTEFTHPPEIIQPMSTTSLPPTSPESSMSGPSCGVDRGLPLALPMREQCEQYVSLFLEQVHGLYWLYSAEQLHQEVEHIYAVEGDKRVSAACLCGLYAIFALGAQDEETEEVDGGVSPTTAEYLERAKTLVTRVCDQADMESVKALCLLSLALQSACFGTASYLYVGTAVRIAYSLGIQLDKMPPSQGLIEKEQRRRLWWTLYVLDQDSALRCGNPCAITVGEMMPPVPFPSERVLSAPVPGLLQQMASLSHIAKQVSRTLYFQPTSSTRSISFGAVQSLVTSLQSWQRSLPPHLQMHTPVSPSHRRAVGCLHIRYWSVVMLLTRPFLLSTALPGARLSCEKQRSTFETLGHMCIEAASELLGEAREMNSSGCLSSRVYFDCESLLQSLQILRLALVKTGDTIYREQVLSCVRILESMEQFGWPRRVLPEVRHQLRQSGIMSRDESAEAPMTDMIGGSQVYEEGLEQLELDYGSGLAAGGFFLEDPIDQPSLIL
ncbi:hypothetical protein BDY21DRAFT_348480 [Lineolata rhizophorae]|uniref:Zn(2)-C6 fungal-type domain-containing protein n=1 Tax=Lineolata rhizophorae TaxID=578093 RepID=A0A6A6NVD0_9PEZI|nr:hypothetical protein BDY21DRAFT_348480 [Lineolata rhizophorae]